MSSERGNKAFIQEVIGRRVCMAHNVRGFPSTQKFRCFQPHTVLSYYPLCDDFGPMNFSSLTRFIDMLDHELSSYPDCRIIYCVEEGKRALTNAAFLLGSYMILRMKVNLEVVCDRFKWLDNLVESFRDATFSTPDFGLTLRDCWGGLARGMSHGWVDLPTKPGFWGMVDIYEYEHYDSVLNGDLHIVVPKKFVAFRGPQDLCRGVFQDIDGCRMFGPEFYRDVFQDMGVSTVIRLNDPEYNKEKFIAHGICHHDLIFDDCTSPPPDVVKAFLNIVDAAPGLVAVHCKAGLGRTGTLIALYMMRSCGFSAREAMGWLRIMRPGSVIGEQQHFLCECDQSAPPAARPLQSPESKAAGAAALAAQVTAAIERRCSDAMLMEATAALQLGPVDASALT